jgi:hypothetical protein
MKKHFLHRFWIAKQQTVIVAFAASLVLSACSQVATDGAVPSDRKVPAEPESGAISEERDSAVNELVGQLHFVFLEQSAVFAYLVRGPEAFILRPTQDTIFTGVNPITPGEGIGFAGRLMNSTSTYRLRGQSSDDATEQLQLVSLRTRRFTLESVELLEPGTGPCTVYFGVLLPPGNSSGGFVPVLPESVGNKKGTFVQDGTGTCRVVMADTGRGQHPTNSFTSNGAVDLNRQASWATGEPN